MYQPDYESAFSDYQISAYSIVNERAVEILA